MQQTEGSLLEGSLLEVSLVQDDNLGLALLKGVTQRSHHEMSMQQIFKSKREVNDHAYKSVLRTACSNLQ